MGKDLTGDDRKRPNILFALADDASHFSAHGHSFVNTPSFDRVAREGVLFHNAFTTNPKCASSRAGILTGLHTWQNRESCLHWNYWPEDLEVFPDMLEEGGYHIGFTGKGWAPGDWTRCGRTRNPVGPEYNGSKLIPPEESCISNDDYAANFKDFLDCRPPDAPFFFWYGGREPHRPYAAGEGQRRGKRLDDVEAIPPYWPQEDLVRADMLDYAFEIEWFDRQLGKMLEILDSRGTLENTLVVVTSDNGAPFPRVKGQMYDDDFRLPFAVMWKDRIRAHRQVNDLISFIDIAPTFLEAAGLEVPESMPGKSLFDIFDASGSGMITAEELYDIIEDPYCMENLADNPAYKEIKEKLWCELQDTLRETADPRIFGKGDVFESYEYVNDAPHSWAHYLAGDWKPQAY